MLNPMLWKKVQGQKHPGRWGTVEHQTPSIKVLFKTNAKSDKHPGIELLSLESKTQLVNQKKNRTHIEEHIYIYIDLLSFLWGWQLVLHIRRQTITCTHMLGYCQLNHWQQISMQFQMKLKYFLARQFTEKYRLQNGNHFASGSMC